MSRDRPTPSSKSRLRMCSGGIRSQSRRVTSSIARLLCSLYMSIQEQSWKTTILILGLYFIALLCATFHHFFFSYLHGRVIEESTKILPFSVTKIPQIYTTTISLVLVTVFRSALVASLGLAYTQYLWQTFRSKSLRVEVIENLFHIRANAVRLFNLSLVRLTPVLFIAAVISWLLPVAMIYPPGALVIALEDHRAAEVYNVSVIPQEPVPTCPRKNGEGQYMEPECGFAQALFFVESETKIRGVLEALSTLAKGVLLDRKIVNLEHPSDFDFSYNLTFQGPKLQCQQANSTYTHSFARKEFNGENETSIEFSYFKTPYPLSMLSWATGEITLRLSRNENSRSIKGTCPRNYKRDENGDLKYTMAENTTLTFPVTTIKCVAATAQYHVNIRTYKGQQVVDYFTENEQLLKPPAASSETNEIQPLRSQQEYGNVVALIDSLGSNFRDMKSDYIASIRFNESDVKKPQLYSLSPSTQIKVCTAVSRSTYGNTTFDSPILALSSFNPMRNQYTAFMRLQQLNLSEALLNEALANITISALSLNIYHGLVNGTTTRTLNTYRFQHKLSFYIPYGLSLLFALPIVVLGLLALRRNGVSAIDGGFLQILMTTTGDTKLRELATTACIGGEENIPKELKKLKVRFGELLISKTSIEYDALPLDKASQITSTEAQNVEIAEPNQYHDHCEAGSENGRKDAGDTQAHEYVSLASASSISMGHTPAIRRTGFGTLEETKSLLKGTRYS